MYVLLLFQPKGAKVRSRKDLYFPLHSTLRLGRLRVEFLLACLLTPNPIVYVRRALCQDAGNIRFI
jgi:hypothetical protein